MGKERAGFEARYSVSRSNFRQRLSYEDFPKILLVYLWSRFLAYYLMSGQTSVFGKGKLCQILLSSVASEMSLNANSS